jgi:hypothetical protein
MYIIIIIFINLRDLLNLKFNFKLYFNKIYFILLIRNYCNFFKALYAKGQQNIISIKLFRYDFFYNKALKIKSNFFSHTIKN